MLGKESRNMRDMKDRYSRFSWSTPMGYDFEEVEETIKEYKQAISDANELSLKKDTTIKMLNEKVQHLTQVNTELNIQLSAVQAPDFTEDESIEILDNFRRELSPQPVKPEQVQRQQPRPQQRPQQPPMQQGRPRINNGRRPGSGGSSGQGGHKSMNIIS